MKIAEIGYEGADGRVLRVKLDDGASFLLDADHPAAALAVNFRNSGDLLSGGSLDALASADEAYRCRRKALDLLSRAEQCRRGLAAKLSRKDFGNEAVKAALDRLEDTGLLDDRRFAEAWARSRLRSRPEGLSRMVSGLMSRGVGGSVARAAVETVLGEAGDPEGDAALERAWSKLSRRSGMTDEKLLAALARRGFAPGRIRRFLAEQSGHD